MIDLMLNGPIQAELDAYEDFYDNNTSDIYQYSYGSFKNKISLKVSFIILIT